MELMYIPIKLSTLIAILIASNKEDVTRGRPIVMVKYGLVRGIEEFTLYEMKSFFSFKGIPYAKPPLNELRFMPPQKPEPWKGVYNGTYYRDGCIQINSSEGKEDCLYINVHTTDPTSNANLPVLVVISGGSFTSGSSQDFAPDFLLNEKDMVIVTFDYRLGPFGFLTLGTSEYSGNMAFKDQRLALQWVNENIKDFGGDPLRVTVYGTSTGASSAHFHVLSKGSANYFQRVILSSGSAYNPWAFKHNTHISEAFQFARHNGAQVTDIDSLTNYLKTADVNLFYAPNSPFLPKELTLASIEQPYAAVHDCDSVDPFFPESPFVCLNSPNFYTDIDAMFGISNNEALYFIKEELTNPGMLKPINENLKIAFPLYSYNRNVDFDAKNYQMMSNEIRKFYFSNNDNQINTESIQLFVELVSDALFNYGVDYAVKHHANKTEGATYYYRFNADGKLNVIKSWTAANELGIRGATHSDDSFYVFLRGQGELKTLYESLEPDSVERKTIKNICQIYANFICYGNPTPKRNPVNFKKIKDVTNFLEIDNDGLSASVYPFQERIAFWNILINKWNRNEF